MGWNEQGAADRIRAAAPAVLVDVLLGLALIYGLGGSPPETLPSDETRSFDVLPDLPPPVPPPPPPTPAVQHRAERSPAPQAEGAAAPPNLAAQTLPLEAPRPIVPPPPAAPAAPLAGTGAQTSAGAAPVPGPGTGAGGTGNGSGSGNGGTGSGAGGSGGGGSGNGGPVGDLSPPRQIAGALRIQDMPEALKESGFHGRVGVLYRVEEDGRVTHCQVTHSSGSALMDQTTCRLIEQRFRYRPARDETGRPFAGNIEEDHYWDSDVLPPERGRRRRGGDEGA